RAPHLPGGQKVQHGAAGYGLAGTALADQPHDLALVDREGDAVDRAHGAGAGAELDGEILDIEQRHGQSFVPRSSAKPSASRLKPTARMMMARPGKKEIHQAWAMKFLPSAIMIPHSAVG